MPKRNTPSKLNISKYGKAEKLSYGKPCTIAEMYHKRTTYMENNRLSDVINFVPSKQDFIPLVDKAKGAETFPFIFDAVLSLDFDRL